MATNAGMKGIDDNGTHKDALGDVRRHAASSLKSLTAAGKQVTMAGLHGEKGPGLVPAHCKPALLASSD